MTAKSIMKVVKRDGSVVPVSFNEILDKISFFSTDLNIDPGKISIMVIDNLIDGIRTDEIDEVTVTILGNLITEHPDYDTLACRIFLDNLYKSTEPTFSKYVNKNRVLYNEGFLKIVDEYSNELDNIVDTSKDRLYNYFGLRTLERSYFLKDNENATSRNRRCYERPQYLNMRIAITIYGPRIEDIKVGYEHIASKLISFASPILYNSGYVLQGLSSCFLTTMKDDSLDAIYDSVKEIAMISKNSGGVSLAISKIRGKHSPIVKTRGTSKGVVPMLKVFDATASYIDQGGKMRKASIAIYLEPWHIDIFEFLDLKKNTGNEAFRCRDLFPALWIPDLFMKRVKNGEKWSLFTPTKAPGLYKVYGKEFEELYTKYENEGVADKVVNAQDLWREITMSIIETSAPFILYKDRFNECSNHSNMGTLECSNLCCEIGEYTSPDEAAVCTLASIILPTLIKDRILDYDLMRSTVHQIVIGLNNAIDRTYLTNERSIKGNFNQRAIGIGVQGLADVFAIMRHPFDSQEARELNFDIFEHLYYYAIEASIELSKEHGPYPKFEGSDFSKGIFQFDYPVNQSKEMKPRMDWSILRESVKRYGIRNSLLVALMPTTTSSQVCGFNECFEPFTSNIYIKRIMTGEYQIINKHLIRDLIDENMWTTELKNRIIENNGRIQSMTEIPKHLRDLYKTSYELSQKTIIDLASDRQMFVDQSQSMNLYLKDTTHGKITGVLFYGWEKGLKTGCYYMHKSTDTAIQITTFDNKTVKPQQPSIPNTCTMDNGCMSCHA